jgi:hypothetical protein
MIIAPGDGSSAAQRRDATFTGEVWATLRPAAGRYRLGAQSRRFGA